MIWIVIAAAVVWWIYKQRNTPKQAQVVEDVPLLKDEGISEEAVLQAQTSFEKNLEDTFLPDAITRRDLYIYRKLMRVWFAKLAGENRFDETMTQKLRRDWLDYMYALRDAKTSHYLSMETYGEDKERSDSYDQESTIAHRKAFAIEDGFAFAVGKEAVAELARIRALEFSEISRDGELAPDGMEFDFEDKPRRKKKAKPSKMV
ncbi:MAG TPA: hypothetical protein VHE10_02425 [Candidatus Paceibacterota bacterium]|nr:hypothetical protein [Candidatus Paceibacterota bacterium]